MAKRPQPCKNPTVRKQTRRAIAKKLVQRKGPKQIGKELGMSRQNVNFHIRAPETQAFIRAALDPYLDEIAGLVRPALKVVRIALTGKRVATADKLRAVKTLGYLMELAEGRKTDGDASDLPPRWHGTLEQLLILHHTTIHVQSQAA